MAHCNYSRARTRTVGDDIHPETVQEVPAYCGTGALNGDYYKSYTWQVVLYEIEVRDNSLEFECCQAFGRN